MTIHWRWNLTGLFHHLYFQEFATPTLILGCYHFCKYRNYLLKSMERKFWCKVSLLLLPPATVEGNVFTRVRHSVREGIVTWHASWDRSHNRGYTPPSPTYPPLLLMTSGGDYRRPVQTCHLRTYPPQPPRITSSGDNWNTHSFQAGSMHFIEVFSC